MRGANSDLSKRAARRARLGSGAAALAAALSAAAAMAPVPAQAQQRVICLWDALPPLVQLRLELAARQDEGLPESVVSRLGADGVVRILQDCGLTQDPATLAVMARYWVSRAKIETGRVRLRQAGVPLDAAEEALLLTAPLTERKAFAEEIMTQADGVAGAAVFRALGALELAMGELTQEQRRAAALYYAALLLADGLAFGAQPPLEDAPLTDRLFAPAADDESAAPPAE